jgi:alpha-L-fucosidase
VSELDTSIYVDSKSGVQGGARYLPPECDVPIRRHWFWQPDDLHTLKSVQHLQAIWYRSIGLGANLLLNVPPDRHGLIDHHDAARLREFAGSIRQRFAHPVHATLAQQGTRIEASFPEAVAFDHIILRERFEDGQRIGRHRLLDGRDDRPIVEGVHTVGSQRVHAVPRVETDRVVIEIDDPSGKLDSVEAHLTGVEITPALEPQPGMLPGKMDNRA